MIYVRVGVSGKRMEELIPVDDFEYIVNRKVMKLNLSAMDESTNAEEVKKLFKQAKSSQQVNFIAGHILPTGREYVRNDDMLISRSLIVLDYDDTGMNESEFKKVVADTLGEFTYYLYPTVRNMGTHPRYRLIIKPERHFNQAEHAWLMKDLNKRIGVNTGDSSNNSWSQMNGLPTTYKEVEEFQGKTVLNTGKEYPVKMIDLAKWKEKNQKAIAAVKKSESIPESLAEEVMKQYVENEYDNLQDRYKYLSAMMVICKAVQTEEITYADGEVFAQMLSCGDPEWAENNLTHFRNEVKIPKKTKYSFMDKFGFYYKKKDSVGKELLKLEDDAIQANTDANKWKESLWRSQKEPFNVIRNIQNLDLIVVNDENLKDVLIYNEFMQVVEKSRMFPWEQTFNKQLTDDDLGELKIYLSKKYAVEFGKENLFDVSLSVAKRSSYHPIKSMIEVKPWDGVKRAESIFIDYLGADNNEYMKCLARKWLVGAIARIYQPGIKFEVVPVLTGKQGAGKSTLAAKLGGGFFSDDLSDMKSKDSKEFLRGSWIVELGELSAMKKSETEEVKAFLSATKDRYRPSYGRITNDYPRTCVFIATTNDNRFLKDLTGSRRFYPVPIDSHDRAKDVFSIEEDIVQQIWAEAFTFYKAGEKVFFSQEMENAAKPYRDDATEEDSISTNIVEYLDILLPDDWESLTLWQKRNHIRNTMENNHKTMPGTTVRSRVTIKEILSELFERDPQEEIRGRSETRKINLIMSNLPGWHQARWREKGIQIRGYERNNDGLKV